jgi:hypothetical protein
MTTLSECSICDLKPAIGCHAQAGADALRIAYFVFAAYCCGHALWTFLARRRFRQQAELLSIDERSGPVKSTET